MNRIVTGIFVGTTISYAILTLIFALDGYPCFRQDAICFLPTSYFINHQHQLINTFYDAGIDVVSHKFLFYPPLFPYVVAMICKLLPTHDNEIQVALTLIDLCSIVIILISAYIYLKKNVIKYDSFFYLFLIIWTIALFSFHGIFEGRPEILSNFFIACFILNNTYKTNRISNYINGLLIGLNAINSPISTFYLVVINAGLLLYLNNFKFKPIIQTALSAILVLSCFAILYPYHLIDLLHGIEKHSSNVVFNRGSTGSGKFILFKSLYISSPYHPFAIFSFLISICYVLYKLIKQAKTAAIFCLLVLLGMISYFALRNLFMTYNFYVLSSLCIFVLLVLFVDILQHKIFSRYTNICFVILSLVLFINASGLFRTAVVYFCTQDKKVSFNDLKSELDLLTHKTKKDKKILITFSLFPYSLDKAKYITYSWDDPSIQFVMMQQSNSGKSQPPEIKDYKLIKNGFISDYPKAGKIQIGNTYPYYQTAIYERNQ